MDFSTKVLIGLALAMLLVVSFRAFEDYSLVDYCKKSFNVQNVVVETQSIFSGVGICYVYLEDNSRIEVPHRKTSNGWKRITRD